MDCRRSASMLEAPTNIQLSGSTKMVEGPGSNHSPESCGAQPKGARRRTYQSTNPSDTRHRMQIADSVSAPTKFESPLATIHSFARARTNAYTHLAHAPGIFVRYLLQRFPCILHTEVSRYGNINSSFYCSPILLKTHIEPAGE